MRHDICVVAVAIAASWALASMAPAQHSSSPEAISADPASNPDQELGRRFLIKPENLPPPKSGPIAASRSLVIPYAGQAPRVMEGFTATPFIIGLEHPRRLLVLPNNDVIVAEQKTGHLTLLRDQDGDGKADYIERYADDFKAPYGLAYRDGFVLVADQEGIWRVPHVSGSLRAGRADQPKITDVPPEERKPVLAAYGQEMITQKGVFGVVAGHQNRHLALDPKTGAMFVGVGSAGNIGVEPEVKASIQRFEADGSGQTISRSTLSKPTKTISIACLPPWPPMARRVWWSPPTESMLRLARSLRKVQSSIGFQQYLRFDNKLRPADCWLTQREWPTSRVELPSL
jgi:glucose/arabinose dehydrogenase